MTASIQVTFLTPLAVLVALAAAVPFAAYLAARRRTARLRERLGLAPPSRPDRRVFAAVAVVVALAVACAQPALTTGAHQRVRNDAAVLFVLDTSRSMAASRTRHSPTRLDRAVAAVRRLRAAIPDVPAGIATFTDRVVPNLLPVVDVPTYDAVLDQAIAIEQPPPLAVETRSTSFSVLDEIPNGDYFAPSVRHAVVVLLTDGETKPFNPRPLKRAFARPPGISLVAMQFWGFKESVYGRRGAEAHYVPDPTSKEFVHLLAAATGGHDYSQGDLAAATARLRADVGHGPPRGIARPLQTHPLAPYVAALALIPLALAFGVGGALRGLALPRGLPRQASATSSARARSIRAASTNPSRS